MEHFDSVDFGNMAISSVFNDDGSGYVIYSQTIEELLEEMYDVGYHFWNIKEVPSSSPHLEPIGYIATTTPRGSGNLSIQVKVGELRFKFWVDADDLPTQVKEVLCGLRGGIKKAQILDVFTWSNEVNGKYWDLNSNPKAGEKIFISTAIVTGKQIGRAHV